MIKAPKGTKDITPDISYQWQYIEAVIRAVCAAFGYREARTPVFEHTELFLRGVGNTTDIVQKEMYTFDDKGGRSITLKPEGTAGVARMFIEHGLFNEPLPVKMYYLNAPVFRYENPQSGRLREHHQFGIEAFGAFGAELDAEIIWLALETLRRLQVTDTALHINSIGCPKCRPDYHSALKQYIGDRLGSLCGQCRERFDVNPLRALDCKVETCKAALKDAPVILDYLCDECGAHFESLKTYLAALDIAYTVDPRIVRGLDYYTKTVFEIISDKAGAQGTVCGGGRYDGLLGELGGSETPGVGFGMGMERLLMVMDKGNIPISVSCKAFVINLADEYLSGAMALVKRLREAGVSAQYNQAGRSVKAQFKFANKLHARYTIVYGGDELARGVVKVKDMETGEEREVPIDSVCDVM